MTITSHHRGSNSGIVGDGVGVGVGIDSEEPGDTTDAVAETARIKQLVGQLQNNLCNVSVLSDPDLDSLSNMDPNSLVDITGKDFMEQLKDSGRLGGEAQMWWLSPPTIFVSMCFSYFYFYH